jgi:hypothetical protein
MLMRVFRAVLLAFAILFAAIQLVPIARLNPPEASNPQAPASIVRLLRRACYDCHSNQTRWPWYSFIAPASWLVSRHVAEARRRLNFSEWDAYASDPDTASHKLAQIADQVASGKMAPWYYRAMHPGARLNVAQRQALIRWAQASAAAMRSSD